MSSMRIRILVADQSEARFYDLGPHSALTLVGRLADPLAHLHDRDLVSDRPGRKFDRAPLTAGRRGATAHHATGGERSARRHEAEVFARRVAAELEQARQRGDFEGLILMSGPIFLGLLRVALPEAIRATLVAEVPKDLLHQGIDAIIEHLPALPALARPS
jgi:protein required for attachment to host cells